MVPIDSKGNLLCLRDQEPLWLVCVCVFSSASHKQTCCSMFCVIAMIESRVTLQSALIFFWQPHNPHTNNDPPIVKPRQKPRWYMSRGYSNKFQIKIKNKIRAWISSLFFLPFWWCFHLFKGTSRWRGRRWCCHKFSKQTVIFLLAVREEKPNYERSLSLARLIKSNCTIEKSE